MTTVCLNMIVKNEAHVIERCLRSVRPFIDAWVIVDTGSTDGTQERIREFFGNDLPGQLVERPWVDFGHNRSEALDLARGWGDYLFVIDADELLVLPEGYRRPVLTEASYTLDVRFGDTRYGRVCLVASPLPWRYVGVLHEYIDCGQPTGRAALPGPTVVVHCDGARSQRDPRLKYADDARVLERALQAEPHNERYVFYLAQSYRDSGQPEPALAAYERRAAMGGWDEEVWFSHYSAALLAEQLEHAPSQVMDRYLRAYELRPQRAEALCQLARYCRLRGQFAQARLFARAAMDTPRPGDILFVDQSVYDWRSADEFAVASYWSGHDADCERVCRALLDGSALPEAERGRVQANLRFAQERLLQLS